MPALTVAALLGALVVVGAASAAQGSEWSKAGGDRQNTRSQPSENKISVGNVGGLAVKWALTTAERRVGDARGRLAPSTSPTGLGYIYAVDGDWRSQVVEAFRPSPAFRSTRRA